MADATYGPKTYRKQGGDEFVIANGGAMKIESGGTLNMESGAILQQYGKVAGVTYVIGTESNNVINVGLQLTDGQGADIAAVAALSFYFSSDAAGKDVAATGPTSLAIGTDGSIHMSGDDSVLAGLLVSEADGDIDIDITMISADTFYLCVILPDGAIDVSGAITFDATT